MDSNGQNLGLHYEGVLEKAGKRFFEGFRKRWFILEGKDLSYYKAQETTEKNLLGIIDLTKVKSVVPFKMINHSFQIISNTRTYTFTAPSPQLMTEWISVLRQAMQLESFSNKRARNSFRESIQDEGYEVVSRSNRSDRKLSGASHQSFAEDDETFDDDNLYSKIESSGSQGKASNNTEDQTAGTYESVGSFKRNNPNNKNQEEQSYEVVGRQDSLSHNEQQFGAYDSIVPPTKKTNANGSEVSDFGSYGVIGETDNKPEKKLQEEPALYSQVQKKPNKYPLVDNSGSPKPEVVSGVGVSKNASGNAASNPMPVLVESDVDDDEEEEEDDNDSISHGNIDMAKDPLPPPIGNNYGADQIKSLLLGIDGDLDLKPKKLKSQEILKEDSSAIPVSCENAFSELKQFLVYLETTDG